MQIEIIDELPTICLNMIVRNESRIISRLLESVADIIDSYCICDTGSTDNTVEIIETFFRSRGIPGKIVHEPFRDFGYNRSFALKACEDMSRADYVLLLDADMILWRSPEYSVESLKRALTSKENAYYIFQGGDSFYYKNTRIVRNRVGIHYWGVTHEFVKTPEGTQYGQFEKPLLFIKDIGDGGSKSDKFERDIRLLKKGLEENPNNDRYTFYLANSYRDHGDHREAIETYRKRIEIGGWYEEIWYSYYSIGKCYQAMGDMVNAIAAWLDAYQFYPKRIENLYEIVSYYRKGGKNELAYLFYVSALKQTLLNPTPDYLFLQKDVYDYKLDYEFSIIGYYCNIDKYDMTRICQRVLNSPTADEGIIRNVMSNYKFYAKALSNHSVSNRLTPANQALLYGIGSQCLVGGEFVRSTPSIALLSPTRLAVVQRLVNYRINASGGYENRQNITTINVVAEVDMATGGDWKIVYESEMDYNRTLDSLYVGLEDVRIMKHNHELLFNANRGINLHHLMVEHGSLDPVSGVAKSGLVLIENQKQVEKNWVLFTDGEGRLKIIYGWHDMIIGDVKPETELEPADSDDEITADSANQSYLFSKTHSIATPESFKHIRGSTNGVRIGDEIWFICHTVSYEDRRYYYHLFVVLDSRTYAVKKYSTLFTFDREKVEYTLGFVYLESTYTFLIGYSKMDCQVEYMEVPRSAIESMLL
jgi:glycosyltransferase involved in cell wall biosynthesis